MKLRTLMFSIVLYLPVAANLQAQDTDPKKIKYLIYPAKPESDFTKLQRLALGGSPQPRKTVIINGSPAIQKDKSIDPKAIDLPGLQEALHEAVRIKIGEEKWRISIAIHYHSRRPDEPGRQTLYWALKGMALDLGYDQISVVSFSGGDEEEQWWKKQIEERKAYDQVGREQPAEDGAGDDFVTVYAVKTPYSRCLFGADCVVNFKQPFVKGWDGKLTADQEKTIVQSAKKLKFEGKARVQFRMATEGVGVEAHSQFHEKTAIDLLKKMGFEKHSTYVSG